MSPCVPHLIGIWKCWFFRRGENRSTRIKTSRNEGENQQQTQPTCGVQRKMLGQRKCWELLAQNFVRFETLSNNTQQHATTCNNMQQGVQTNPTCNIQQSCELLSPVQTDARYVGQQLPALLNVSCCVRSPCCVFLGVVAQYLIPFKVLAACKRTQHCWLITPNIVGSCCVGLHEVLANNVAFDCTGLYSKTCGEENRSF